MAKLSRDQKRKKKLEERNRRARQQTSLAYDGDKFHRPDLAPLWLRTETGIYEAFVISKRRLHDRTVATAVEALILKLRAGTLPPLQPPDVIYVDPNRLEDTVMERIQGNWLVLDEADRQSKDDKIGVLRSILGTLELKREGGPISRGYLHYLERFLTRDGLVTVEMRPESDEQLLASAESGSVDDSDP